MRTIAYIAAGIFIFFGVIFIWGAFGSVASSGVDRRWRHQRGDRLCPDLARLNASPAGAGPGAERDAERGPARRHQGLSR